MFLSRTAKATLSVAAAGLVAASLYDKQGPSGEPDTELVTLPDFSVPPKEGQSISIVKGSDRMQTVDKAIDLLGGIERFVKPGDVVVIKPNVAFTSAPALGATTNPRACRRGCKAVLQQGTGKDCLCYG